MHIISIAHSINSIVRPQEWIHPTEILAKQTAARRVFAILKCAPSPVETELIPKGDSQAKGVGKCYSRPLQTDCEGWANACRVGARLAAG